MKGSRTASAGAAASTRARRCGCSSPSSACSRTRTTRCRSSTWPRPRCTGCRRAISSGSTTTRDGRRGPSSRCCVACRRTRTSPRVSGPAREAAARLLADLDRAVAEVPRRRTGEVLYGFLQWSGLLGRLAKESSAEAEAKVKNIARFFEAVKAYGDVAEHDRVPAFVAHLDLLREAGDDPAVAEADLDEDAVHVLTVHKAKGRRVPHRLSRGRRCRVAVPPPAPGRPPVAPRGPGEGGADRRRQRSPPRGATALLRRHDPGARRAGAHLGQRLRHLARAEGLAVRGGGAGPAVAEARLDEDGAPRGARANAPPFPSPWPRWTSRSPRTSC